MHFRFAENNGNVECEACDTRYSFFRLIALWFKDPDNRIVVLASHLPREMVKGKSDRILEQIPITGGPGARVAKDANL